MSISPYVIRAKKNFFLRWCFRYLREGGTSLKWLEETPLQVAHYIFASDLSYEGAFQVGPKPQEILAVCRSHSASVSFSYRNGGGR